MNELIIKAGGAVCVVSATVLWGEFKAKSLTLRLQQLQQFQQALHLLTAEISYTVTPLPAAFENISKTIKGTVGEIFGRAGMIMRKDGDSNAREAWQQAVSELFPETFFSEEDVKIVEQLGTSLGMSDREGQLKQIKLVSGLLKGALDEALERRNRNERMWRYLGLLGGLVLVVVFI